MSIKFGLEYVGHIDPWTDEERLSDEEIVRCRDCKCRAKACCWCINGGAEPDGFCAWGERRDE